MGRALWLVYILSFFLPIFGFITFWVSAGREGELKTIARNSLIASFIGTILLIILAFVGITLFEVPWHLLPK